LRTSGEEEREGGSVTIVVEYHRGDEDGSVMVCIYGVGVVNSLWWGRGGYCLRLGAWNTYPEYIL